MSPHGAPAPERRFLFTMSNDDDDLENPEFTGGKINTGLGGMGTASEDDVRRRATELAIIDGLTAADVDDRHLAQAYAELHGVDLPADDAGEGVEELTEWNDPPDSAGRHVPNVGLGDDHVVESLVEEGLAEAQHERMLRSVEASSREDDLSEEP